MLTLDDNEMVLYPENAIETEFAFLLLHFHRLKTEKIFASASELIADFHLGKDLYVFRSEP